MFKTLYTVSNKNQIQEKQNYTKQLELVLSEPQSQFFFCIYLFYFVLFVHSYSDHSATKCTNKAKRHVANFEFF